MNFGFVLACWLIVYGVVGYFPEKYESPNLFVVCLTLTLAYALDFYRVTLK